MARTVAKHSKNPATALELDPSPSPWIWLTRLAFFLAIVLVITRATIPESVSDQVLPVPGTSAAPATPGPATGLVLDLLCCLPALLVLLRRAIDGRFVLRTSWARWIMLLLAGWTLLSVLWSSNKFIAIVSAAHWASALVLLWAASQLVRSWLQLRLLAGVGFGILLVLLVQGYYYRFADLPDLQREWGLHRAQLLHDRGAAPNSIEEIQLEKNIQSGEVTGFSLSRNTYAALLVLLGILAAGIVIQRASNRDRPAWIIPLLAGIGLSIPMLYLWVQSKTAYATPFIGALLLAAIALRRRWIAAHSRRVFWGGVGLFVIAVAAVVGHGLRHGTLFQESLTFRWRYWVGSMRVFVHHPWIGVGWANFGPYYLAHRLARAVEEPKDPHDFLVRALVELGIIGGLLMIGWMLRLWWELTQNPAAEGPAGTQAPAIRGPALTMAYLGGIAIAAIVLNATTSIDFNQPGSWVFVELFKRAIFFLALLTGIAVVAIQSSENQALDDRPAPWILYAMLIGLGLFLVHNLIDFSMFEPGPMFLFALLMGGALGMRPHVGPACARGKLGSRCMLAAGCIAWLIAAAGTWNVVLAESLSQDADQLVRAGNPRAALDDLLDAAKLVPVNADYTYRAAVLAGGNLPLVRKLLARTIATDPAPGRYRQALAEVDANAGAFPQALSEYQQALDRDPNNMDLRTEYADLLRKLGRGMQAAREYQRVLALNAILPPHEIRRLPQERADQLRAILKSLPPA